MNDPDDTKLKAEIDGIMKNINAIIKKIENLDPVKIKKSRQNENWCPFISQKVKPDENSKYYLRRRHGIN